MVRNEDIAVYEFEAACPLNVVGAAAVSHHCSDMYLQLSHSAEDSISHYH